MYDDDFDAAMAMHHCLICGWTPFGGMARYLEIQGPDAVCICCDGSLPTTKKAWMEATRAAEPQC